MIDSTVVNQQIADGIAAELNGCEAFKKILLSEQQALIDGNVDDLAKITEQKNASAEQLNTIAEYRMARIKALGFTRIKTVCRNGSVRQSGAATKTWKSLLTIAAEIQHINEVNGKLIYTRLQVTERTLSVLLQQSIKLIFMAPADVPQAHLNPAMCAVSSAKPDLQSRSSST